MLELKNADVAAKYDAAFEQDQIITLPGSYNGPLSKITLEAADLLVKQESNLLVLKTNKTIATPAPAKDK